MRGRVGITLEAKQDAGHAESDVPPAARVALSGMCVTIGALSYRTDIPDHYHFQRTIHSTRIHI